MDYYHNLVTEESWRELKSLQEKIKFTLIGGWAVYLYTKALKSKNIDIIIDFNTLSILKNLYPISKNDRLKKYEAIKDKVQIDIYLPYYSIIGIAVEELADKTREIEGFTVLDPNYLFALKLYTLTQRGRLPKGHKDFIDVISLHLSKQIDYQKVKKILEKYQFSNASKILKELLNENTQCLELDLNKHLYVKIKKDIYFSI